MPRRSRPAHDPAGQPPEEEGRKDEQHPGDQDEVLHPDHGGRRTRREGARERPGDRGRRHEWKQPPRLARIERCRRDGPVHRDRQQGPRLDRQPQQRHHRRVPIGDGGPQAGDGRGEQPQDRHEQGHAGLARERGAVAHGDDEPERAEGDEQEWQDPGQILLAEAAQQQCVDADLAEPARRLDHRDHERHLDHQGSLSWTHAHEAGQAPRAGALDHAVVHDGVLVTGPEPSGHGSTRKHRMGDTRRHDRRRGPAKEQRTWRR